jgi:PadR family transcriptional regulator PadR
MISTQLLKGTLQTIVLKILADHGKMYGYEIGQTVKDLSEREILLTEGALYPTLHKLELEGFIASETVHVGRRLRKYYSLTNEGRATAQHKVEEFATFVRMMTFVLNVKVS